MSKAAYEAFLDMHRDAARVAHARLMEAFHTIQEELNPDDVPAPLRPLLHILSVRYRDYWKEQVAAESLAENLEKFETKYLPKNAIDRERILALFRGQFYRLLPHLRYDASYFDQQDSPYKGR